MESILGLIITISMRYDIDPVLLAAIVKTESNGKITAIGSKGEQGLMQLRPEHFPTANLLNAKENLETGAKYLKQLQKRCKHAAYFICFNYGVAGGNALRWPQDTDYYKKMARHYNALNASLFNGRGQGLPSYRVMANNAN